LNEPPDLFVKAGADEDLARTGAVAVARCLVHRIANGRKLDALGRADETVKHFTAVNANADFAGGETSTRAFRIDAPHCRLHIGCRLYRVLVLASIWLRASKHGEDRIADELVDGSIEAENGIDQDREIGVQQIHDFLRVHTGRQTREPPDVGAKNRDPGSFASQTEFPLT
jgi:hypothetical protein